MDAQEALEKADEIIRELEEEPMTNTKQLKVEKYRKAYIYSSLNNLNETKY